MAKTTTKPISNKIVKAVLRAYQVGFGDCFLLSFEYADQSKRHVLIDFGSTGLPKDSPDNWMLQIAEDIREQCRNEKGIAKLDVVVATHRHKDHISGFATEGPKNADGETTGDIIRSCLPDAVIQPWTEDPELDDASLKTKFETRLVDETSFQNSPEKHFVATLGDMHDVAGMVKTEAKRLSVNSLHEDDFSAGQEQTLQDKTSRQLFFMGDNNLSNKSAVMNLRAMAKRNVSGRKAGYYVHSDEKLNLSQILPGVRLHVLGPPTLKQHGAIIRQRSRDENEFWMFHAMLKNYWRMQAATTQLSAEFEESDAGPQSRLFPNARVYQNFAPSHTRWFIRRIREVRGEQLLSLVRILDKALNNTSVILLFEAGGKKLLFPGDAQIENWEYALGKEEVLKLLKDTHLYKVGHHGSRNATPKTLWRNLSKRSTDENNPDRLQTICSTMAGKHGHTVETAVPRATLVKELKAKSHYSSTETIKNDKLRFLPLEIDF